MQQFHQKYFLELAYKGTRYSGWQRQKPNHVISVQGTIEAALEKMLRQEVSIVGCGRTDAGVHASQFFANFIGFDFDYDPVERLNRILPDDISIARCFPVPARAHAQYDARSRTYEYRIHGRKYALWNELSSWYNWKEINWDKVQEATMLIVENKDFEVFCKRPNVYKNTLCTVEKCFWNINEEDTPTATFTITANRFLRGMIRLLIGNLIAVGRGEISVQEFSDYLEKKQSPKFYRAAYPQGLYLSEVKYDFF